MTSSVTSSNETIMSK